MGVVIHASTCPNDNIVSQLYVKNELSYEVSFLYAVTGFILERKRMRAIFQKKDKKGRTRTKYLKIWVKMYKIWKYFEKE